MLKKTIYLVKFRPDEFRAADDGELSEAGYKVGRTKSGVQSAARPENSPEWPSLNLNFAAFLQASKLETFAISEQSIHHRPVL